MAKKSNSADMHEKILQSALVVFSAKGYSAATIKDISRHAGCNTVTIFHHFEDKLGLFFQVVERFCPGLSSCDVYGENLIFRGCHDHRDVFMLYHKNLSSH